MKPLGYYLWLFRAWLFKFIFGIDARWLAKSVANYQTVIQVLSEHQEYLNSLEATLIQMRKEMGGEGWTETIQQAIMNLSQRIEYHREVLQTHQDNISALSELEVVTLPTPSEKKDLN
jgi:hypothetical protein